jgi:hypothetical protein
MVSWKGDVERSLGELAEVGDGEKEFSDWKCYILALAAGSTDASRTIHGD